MKNIPIIIPYFDAEEARLISESLDSGWVAQGPAVNEFEHQIADYEGVAHAIATTSCTTALHLALAAMGLSAGYDVLVPSFTFVATANAVEYTGATAVFIDVRTDTFCLDIDFLQKFIENNYYLEDNRMVNKKTNSVLFGAIAVHLFGLCSDVPAIMKVADRYNIKILEDSACALGASINGVHEGAFGNPSCLSFHARKSITTGEGGMVLTDDNKLAETMSRLRSHGASASALARHESHSFLMPDFNEIGFNYRMTDIQAAMGIAQIKKFDYILEKRCERAARYDRLLKEAAPFLNLPQVPAGFVHTYQSYVTMLDSQILGLDSVEAGNKFRNKLMAHLEENGIATRQGTHAVHMLGYYSQKYGYKPEDLPGAYACDRLSLALPLYVSLSDDDQDYVVEKISAFHI